MRNSLDVVFFSVLVALSQCTPCHAEDKLTLENVEDRIEALEFQPEAKEDEANRYIGHAYIEMRSEFRKMLDIWLKMSSEQAKANAVLIGMNRRVELNEDVDAHQDKRLDIHGERISMVAVRSESNADRIAWIWKVAIAVFSAISGYIVKTRHEMRKKVDNSNGDA